MIPHEKILKRIVLPVLLILTLACSLFGGGDKDEILGGDYTNSYGGFTIGQVNGYSLMESGAVVSMAAPDAVGEIGPMVMVTGGTTDAEMTNQELLDKMIAEMPVMEWTKGKKVTINGTRGLLAGGQADYGDQQVEGQLFVAMVNDTQQFSLLGLAPHDRWKELEPVIEAVLKSASFFEPGSAAPAMSQNAAEPMNEQPAAAPASSGPAVLHQWASYAEASSSYGSLDWSAMQAAGEPNVDDCGDNRSAWAPYNSNTEEWLEVSYDVPVIPTEINIYQSYNPSQVVEVQLIDVDDNYYYAWSGVPESVSTCPDLMTIYLELDEDIYVDKVLVFVDQSVMGWGWVEIDAVELVGYTGSPSGSAEVQNVPAGGQPASSGPAAAAGAASNGGANPYSPNDLSAGSFAYKISGYENDEVQFNNAMLQSNESFYTVGFVNDTQRYTVSLFLPTNGLKQGVIDMAPYDQGQSTTQYTAAIYINAFLYLAESGQIDIQNDPGSGKITGTFTFTARSKDFTDRVVTVSGAFKDISLK